MGGGHTAALLSTRQLQLQQLWQWRHIGRCCFADAMLNVACSTQSTKCHRWLDRTTNILWISLSSQIVVDCILQIASLRNSYCFSHLLLIQIQHRHRIRGAQECVFEWILMPILSHSHVPIHIPILISNAINFRSNFHQIFVSNSRSLP